MDVSGVSGDADSDTDSATESEFEIDIHDSISRPDSTARDDGLKNLGNTCYINSILQALFHSSTFRCEVLSLEGKPTHPIVLQRLQQVFKSLSSNECKEKKTENLKLFNQVSRPDSFVNGQQQDCCEFLNHLLVTIQQQAEVSSTENVAQSFLSSRTISLECTVCNTVSDRIESFYDLQLALLDTDSKEKIKIKDLLDEYLKPEIMDGENEVNCSNCGFNTVTKRQVRIVSHPVCLIVSLKLFKYNSTSRNTEKKMIDVKYTQYLKLQGLDGYQSYQLFAVIIHSGPTLNSGHYYSWVR